VIDSVWLYSCPLVLIGKSRLESRQKALGSEEGKVVGTKNILWFCIRAKMEQLLYLGII
jgi:hypothetical protein